MERKVLIAPLNWGLGHATRCVPIIDFFIDQGWKVVLAGDGHSFEWLKSRYTSLEFESLKGYDVQYSEKVSFAIKMLLSLPKIYAAVQEERKKVKQLQQKYRFDLLISDNRYGVGLKEVRSYFIGHQLNIKFPYFAKQVFAVQRYLLRVFDALLIPDYPLKDNLAGDLSKLKKGQRFEVPIYHLGALSRFYHYQVKGGEKEFDILAVVSGPEPYRSSFFRKILEQSEGVDKKLVLISHDVKVPSSVPNNVTVVLNPVDAEFVSFAHRSEMVLSRPGYSTLMDLVYLRKPGYFVPTPGQTEQEYLAAYLKEQGWANVCSQEEFDLSTVGVSARSIPFHPHNFRAVLEKLIQK